ncbi:similar to Saccharomyces cerevisiae YOL011W PLB3 Phospholipase B (lysophospholipase) involved in phospholipid metabolism [Maudiozyma barnettii]|uniref:Lysophospholipase n=1 Tax=Maudiozyma barnettii TaxID=61262 RepID=A0A8H2VHX6_9SACH|nr:uncharacterized protein KABA2_06S08184 [Kazachstania barnettii]CAB4255554.1 similar to Saccharomyces cerevisiae YOL011W PLB3 Phospholipase B (lysophospholipase) involved in phospholipid metabolism [Kazachstania barnettii]CAD1784052.1 similar to Saccharomyces cerevisiae YOL011W PLB3 Phospholipase B (lysophospholipase) involved in phospholipid metabolism [Kazachstania barnettii]
MQLKNLVIAAALAASADAWSPTNSYVPANVSCADDIKLIREASKTLSDNETSWLQKRDPIASEALLAFVQRAMANISSADDLAERIFSNSSTAPKIGIAASGGGYRAMLSGAGMIAAMDNRTVGANEHGLGGLLQGSTYLAGLSGGNWMTGTLAWNNWTSVQDILNGFYNDSDTQIWDLDHSVVTPGGINVFKTGSRWDHISDAVQAKQDAGFNISLADVWGRALAYNFFPSLYRGGVGYTWSTLRDTDVFKNGEMPFPISVADGRYPGTTVINLNATVFEFNPFEMGSWDPTLNSFADVKYLGTNVSNGSPVNQGKCIAGFDNTGFVMGTSSTLFNQFLLQLNTTSLPSFIQSLAKHFLNDLSDDYNDIAIYAPNPFRDADTIASNYSQSIAESEYLFLVDGGEDLENIPLVPLIQKQRDLDVVFALDNSADTNSSWPDGTSLVSTYQRQFGLQGNGMAFPYVPDENTFVNLGLNTKPTFFGCDASNMTDLDYIPPLIVYIPNSYHSYQGNQSTFKLSYSTDERIGVIQNGFESATRGNLTDDSDYIGCIGCAILRRKQQSLNATLPSECEQCFTNYCWNGTIASASVNGSDAKATTTDIAAATAEGVDSSATGSSTSVSGTVSHTSSTKTSKTKSSKSKNAANILNAQNIGLFSLISALMNFL